MSNSEVSPRFALDGTQRLIETLHRRPPVCADWLGGSDARMLHEAADRITTLEAQNRELRAVVERLQRRYAIRNDGTIVCGPVIWDDGYHGGGYVSLGSTPSGVGDMRLAVSQTYETPEAAEAASTAAGNPTPPGSDHPIRPDSEIGGRGGEENEG